ncbi:Avirulence protein (Avh) [Phytophthora palmivora]|uniref:RxLR effector protein n=1 Tax=Phytophthora palmivora TaxID=4796 RepID=A0A2P4XTS1_9STRA|nr:Avirulence protein (Avh) [Phytophthora palmivora]
MRATYTLALVVMTLIIGGCAASLSTATHQTTGVIGSVDAGLNVKRYLRTHDWSEERGINEAMKQILQKIRVIVAKIMIKMNFSFQWLYLNRITPEDVYKALKLKPKMAHAYRRGKWGDVMKTKEYQMWREYHAFWTLKKRPQS